MQKMQEMWVPSLDWEDALEKEMTTRSSILAWEFPWTEEPGAMGSQSQIQLSRHACKTVFADFGL